MPTTPQAPQTTYSDAPSAGYAGQLVGDSNYCVSAYNEEASAEIRFGAAVKWGTTSQGVLLPSAESSKIKGVVVRDGAHSTGDDGDLGDEGLVAGASFMILRRGRILVPVPSGGCSLSDRGWVRADDSETGEYLGAIENADDASDTVDCTNQIQFMQTAADGALCEIEVDFTNEP